MKKALAWLLGVIGVLFLLLALYYWITPAGSLPAFLPGYEPGIAATHFKHGLASLIIGLAILIIVWFWTGSKKA